MPTFRELCHSLHQGAPRPDAVNGKVHETSALDHDTATTRKLFGTSEETYP